MLGQRQVAASQRRLPVLCLPVLCLPVLCLPVLCLPVLCLPVLCLPVLCLPVLCLPVLSPARSCACRYCACRVLCLPVFLPVLCLPVLCLPVLCLPVLCLPVLCLPVLCLPVLCLPVLCLPVLCLPIQPERFSRQTTRSLRRAADEIAVVVERLWLAERTGDQERSAAFLAQVDSLLAGAPDGEDITMLGAMLVVPRIAEWCAFYLADDQGSTRLAHVWHSDERMLGPLRAELEGPPTSAGRGQETTGYRLSATEFPLVYGTQRLGTMLLDPERVLAEPSLAGLLDDLSRRIAFALDRTRGHRREAATSRILQQSLRPAKMGDVPGIESSVVYEPAITDCAAGGDFYDLFQTGADRWCLVLGDVCGSGPEAAAVTGLARHAARLLARDGHGVNAILDRLNRAVADDYAPDRFLSMLCVEIVPLDSGGARLRLASAGHPLPLLLRATGQVEQVGEPQLLLGAMPDSGYHADPALLAPGDVLICVTDGVTERTDGARQLDDDDGLARLITGWTGLPAAAIADRIWAAVHDFSASPPHDDVAVLVLVARTPERSLPVGLRRRGGGPGARRANDRAAGSGCGAVRDAAGCRARRGARGAGQGRGRRRPCRRS